MDIQLLRSALTLWGVRSAETLRYVWTLNRIGHLIVELGSPGALLEKCGSALMSRSLFKGFAYLPYRPQCHGFPPVHGYRPMDIV